MHTRAVTSAETHGQESWVLCIKSQDQAKERKLANMVPKLPLNTLPVTNIAVQGLRSKACVASESEPPRDSDSCTACRGLITHTGKHNISMQPTRPRRSKSNGP